MDYFTPKTPLNFRPKGTDADLHRDEGHQGWTYRQWAWEFLRRNPEFIKACDPIQPDDVAKKEAVAAKFKLKRFKHCNEDFAQSGTKRPRFLPADVSYWPFAGPEQIADSGYLFLAAAADKKKRTKK